MRRLRKDIGYFVGAGVGLGLGTAIVSGAESRAGVSSSVLPAFSTMGRMMAPIGIGMMGMHTLRILRKTKKKYKW